MDNLEIMQWHSTHLIFCTLHKYDLPVLFPMWVSEFLVHFPMFKSCITGFSFWFIFCVMGWSKFPSFPYSGVLLTSEFLDVSCCIWSFHHLCVLHNTSSLFSFLSVSGCLPHPDLLHLCLATLFGLIFRSWPSPTFDQWVCPQNKSLCWTCSVMSALGSKTLIPSVTGIKLDTMHLLLYKTKTESKVTTLTDDIHKHIMCITVHG